MLSIAFSAILASSLGQLPPPPPADNPMDNVLNILRQDVPIYDKSAMYGNQQAYPPGYVGAGAAGAGWYGWDSGNQAGSAGYGYPAGSYPAGAAPAYPADISGYPANTGGTSGGGQGKTSIAGVGVFINGYAPKCNQGAYMPCLGTYIGPFPGGTACPGKTTQMGCQQGGYCPVQPSYGQSYPVQTGSGVLGRLEDEKEHKEINLRLEQLKLNLSKMNDRLQEMNEKLQEMAKRVESSERAGVSAEGKIKDLRDEIKQRWFLEDVESRFDQRIKPIEEGLKQLSRRMEYLHKSPDLKKSGGMGLEETLLLSIEDKLDKLRDQMNEEKIQRIKLQERVKKLESGGGAPPPPKVEVPPGKEIPLPPPPGKIDAPPPAKLDAPPPGKGEKGEKDDIKKDEPKKDELKKDTSTLSKLTVARVSHVQSGAPADRAVLIVNLPADAKLFLNGHVTKLVGGQRVFVTPQLEPGAVFVYNLRVELMYNGQLLTQTRTVPFRAGGQAQIVFEGPNMGVLTAGN